MIGAHIVADSISPEGKRLVSLGVTAHRFILAEINTHRMLSQSYRSSWAVPSKRLIEEVRTNPAMPVFWGANEKGMSANEELDDINIKPGWLVSDRGYAKKLWQNAAIEAARAATLMADAGLHKQIANRVLEPFLWVHGIITATEWDNFFCLRLHKTAQPEFRVLADATWAAMKESEPTVLLPGQWHLPYIDDVDWGGLAYGLPKGEKLEPYAIKQSVARCARSSYNSFATGKRSTIEEDLATYAKLNIPGTEHYDPSQPIHASPAEHQGTPDDKWHNPAFGREWANPNECGNFAKGWRQYRKTLPGEAVAPLPEEYK